VAVHSTGFFAVLRAVAVALVGASFAPVLAVGAPSFGLAALFEAGFFDALCAPCCATSAVPVFVLVFLLFIVAMVPFARLVRA
jgi:hypothetical protein